MTPAIDAAKKVGVTHTVHAYEHDPSCAAYGTEAAEKMGVAATRVFKTLVVQLDGKVFAVGIIPVAAQLSMKLIAKAAGAKKAAMADRQDVERITGYVLGGVSPLGQKRRLKSFIDASARQFPTVYVSAGRRGLEIELAPDDLARLTGAAFADLAAS
ncbi:MAG: Cys-tRNA(Pro) deacylase [Gammaproteobacteria bacterium]|nr:Cys-tRNA(Pro) deacylase [Gammaproteobacteria bacterium]